MRISVCTLAKGRRDHLVNLVLGLRCSPRPPDELVIAVMRAERWRSLPPASFPVRQVLLGDDGLPLAAARNAAAAEASGDLLVFLDVDCIPAPALLDDYAAAARGGGLLMGEVGFLPPGAADKGIDFASFEALAVPHAERPAPPAEPTEPCRDYRCFWSLNFAIPAAGFKAAGGFDERYVGAGGGEDVDFARAALSAGLPLTWVRGAKAYHQHVAEQVPPVSDLDAVLANAELFHDKWAMPVMEEQLRAFELMGLVERTGDGWRKLREPESRDIELSEMQADQPYASMARVIERLERDSAGRSGPLRPAA